MEQILTNIANAGPVLVPIIYSLLAAAFLDTVAGIWAAWKSNTFSWEYAGEFIKTHVLERIFPIVFQLLGGVAIGGTDNLVGTGILTAAGAQAALYLAETVASAGNNVKEGQAGVKGLPNEVDGVIAEPDDLSVDGAIVDFEDGKPDEV